MWCFHFLVVSWNHQWLQEAKPPPDFGAKLSPVVGYANRAEPVAVQSGGKSRSSSADIENALCFKVY